MSLHSNRRQFLSTGVLSTGAAVAVTSAVGPGSLAAVSTTRLVDTHLHCFAGMDSRFPYHQRAPYRPDAAARPEQLLKCMDGAGVAYAVVVHPEPYQDDHRYLEHCLKTGQDRLKGTLLLFADRPGSIEKMPALVERLNVISARIHAYAPKRLPPFGKPELRNLWKQAAEHDLAVELHFEPRYAPGFEPLIREFSKTRVIIDHLGRPLQGTPREHALVVRWSRYPNTVMKLSSLASTRNYPHRDIRPIVKQLTAAYGAERMIYGGGFNAQATPQTYREAFAYGRSLISHLSNAEQGKILGENAVEMFGFGKAS